MSGRSVRAHSSFRSLSFQLTSRPFIRSLIIRQRRSNSATFTGWSPTTRRDESPRPMPIAIRPFEMSCIVAYQLAVIVGSRMPGLVTKCPSLIFSVRSAARTSVAYDSCQRMCESYVHAYSKPCRSAYCISSSIRDSGGSGRTVTPKVSMRSIFSRLADARNPEQGEGGERAQERKPEPTARRQREGCADERRPDENREDRPRVDEADGRARRIGDGA